MDTHSPIGESLDAPKRKYFGAIFDEYTPQVEAQLLRDCIVLLEVARKQRYDEVVLVCESEKPDALLAAINMRRVTIPTLTTEWLVYRTQEQWPMVPEGATLEVQRDLWVPTKNVQLTVMKDAQSEGYYLPPQGRISPDTISLLRPAPNGYIPADPALMLIWSKVDKSPEVTKAAARIAARLRASDA